MDSLREQLQKLQIPCPDEAFRACQGAHIQHITDLWIMMESLTDLKFPEIAIKKLQHIQGLV